MDPFAEFGIVQKKPPQSSSTTSNIPIGSILQSTTSNSQHSLRSASSPIIYEQSTKSPSATQFDHSVTYEFDPFFACKKPNDFDPFGTSSPHFDVFAQSQQTAVPTLSLPTPPSSHASINNPQDLLDMDFLFTTTSTSNTLVSPLTTGDQVQPPSASSQISKSANASSGNVKNDLEKLREMYGLDMQSISADEEDEFYTESTTATRVASEIFSPRPANHPVHKKGGRYATVGAGEALSPQLEDDASYNTKIVRETDLNLPTEGLILGRLSVRSLVVQEWKEVFWVLSSDHHKRPMFGQDSLSLLLYRSRRDYYNYPKGENIKKEVPIRANLNCTAVRYKDYEGYGPLHYFMLEENTEYGTVPVAKFASSDRNEVDILWLNLKTRITTARREVAEKLASS